jgi:hypothetical protein
MPGLPPSLLPTATHTCPAAGGAQPRAAAAHGGRRHSRVNIDTVAPAWPAPLASPHTHAHVSCCRRCTASRGCEQRPAPAQSQHRHRRPCLACHPRCSPHSRTRVLLQAVHSLARLRTEAGTSAESTSTPSPLSMPGLPPSLLPTLAHTCPAAGGAQPRTAANRGRHQRRVNIDTVAPVYALPAFPTAHHSHAHVPCCRRCTASRGCEQRPAAQPRPCLACPPRCSPRGRTDWRTLSTRECSARSRSRGWVFQPVFNCDSTDQTRVHLNLDTY